MDTKTGGWDYDWNPENLMNLVKQNGGQQQAYLYDGLGRRTKVDGTSSSTWTVSIFSGMDAIFEKDNAGAVTKYVYANGMRIAKITSTGAVQHYLGDHLGSTRQIRDSSRNLAFSAEYEPFGKPYAITGSEAYKFTSEKHDDPTGFVYLRARQYDPDIGRFVSLDPVLGALSAPQTLNRYAYVVNNPLRYVDPIGGKTISSFSSRSPLARGSGDPRYRPARPRLPLVVVYLRSDPYLAARSAVGVRHRVVRPGRSDPGAAHTEPRAMLI